jgi:hypothetical protein
LCPADHPGALRVRVGARRALAGNARSLAQGDALEHMQGAERDFADAAIVPA